MIRERAALGKEFERRDSFSSLGAPYHSPTAGAGAGAGGHPGTLSPGAPRARSPGPLAAGAAPPRDGSAGRERPHLPPLPPLSPNAAGCLRPPLAPGAFGRDAVPSPPPQWPAPDGGGGAAAPPPAPSAPCPLSPRGCAPVAAAAARRGSPTLSSSLYGPTDAAFQQLLRSGTQSLAPGSVTAAASARSKSHKTRKRVAKLARRLQAAG